MAMTNPLPLLLILLIAATSTARPCKTIFYFSSTTTTTTYFPNSQNPSYVTLTTTTTRFRNPISIDSQPMTSSSKDIMSVVGALLFGVGCGALTAATMFFIWALCSPRGYDSDDEKMGYMEIEDDDDLKKKKKKNKKVAAPPLVKEVV